MAEPPHGEPVPVPGAEADLLRARIGVMIEHLDGLVLRRSGRREALLAGWDAPNRPPWDEDFFTAQLELQAAIDDLQAFRGAVDEVLDAIVAHNEAATQPPTGTTTTTPPTSTTASASPPGGGR